MISIQCKKCRRAGQKLFLKGERCYTPKCAMVKKPYPPGIHGKRRAAFSEYGKQLLEKQKIRHTYGVREQQFKKYIQEIAKKTGDKRELLLKKLEKRLDNVIYRLGWAKSRTQARQLISHNHILVNNKRVNVPSYETKIGDVISLKSKSFSSPLFKDLKDALKKYEPPSWLTFNLDKMEAEVTADVSDIDLNILQSLGMIIEFYSR